MELGEIERVLLRKLFHYRYIGHRHTSITNATRGFPKDQRKQVKKAIDRLAAKGLIRKYPSTGEIHISIVQSRLDEVKRILEEETSMK